ncbi:MAG: glycoside hydrolase TIM-barrel-like domain-containing protein, partial [candidate division WOR-3 bacterium]|nr:glycoside hydrolase TIM-barrel-like domain-containing protein [candidate division WOR-3 bacterium]
MYYQKGMSVPSWQQNEYLNDSVVTSLSVLKTLGVDNIVFTPTWYQYSVMSNEIYPTHLTPSDSAVRNVIKLAHRLDYKIMLKPHLDIINDGLRQDINPAQFSIWFSNYRNFILHYANIAQELAIEQFCIGTELRKLSNRAEWKSLIDTVKKVYNGKLTYAANWDEYPRVNFWQDLDFIGINAYFPLAESREATIEEYLENFELWLRQIDNFQASLNKKIIITEVGFRSIKGCGWRPYDWQSQGIMDEQSQADAYQTILETLSRKSWLAGIYFWKWDPILKYDSLGYSPYQKKAEVV